MDKFKVLVLSVKNDKSGKEYVKGEVITTKDFPKGVLKHWAEKQPPVLAKVVERGSNAKR